ncbi:MAG TPA: aspartyl protease family protein [Vicinamibacterales bacterium]|nr:aspartyl protease family protein [Vicinamibacterales bacterium]
MFVSARLSKGPVLAVLTAAMWTYTAAAQESATPLQLLAAGDVLMAGSHYGDALRAYRRARETDDATVRIRAGAGVVRSLLRLGLFKDGVREGAAVAARDPQNASAVAINADSLWAFGLFFEAEQQYAAALRLNPSDPGGLHGRGRSLAAQRRLDEGQAQVEAAIAIDPTDPAYQYTLASIYEQQRLYPQAADALDRYVQLLPRRDDSDMVKWAKTESQFLRSFKSKKPFEIVSNDESYTMPFRIANGRVLVKGRVNGGSMMEFAVDTGADQAVLTTEVASRNHVTPFATLQSAGIGDLGIGYRGLQIARMDELEIGALRVHNVACLIKNPPLKGLPGREGDGFSPLVFGLSLSIDYARRQLTMARQLPDEPAAIHLPLRMQRLAVVRGVVNGSSPASFVVDTGGEAMSVSRTVASQVDIDPDVRLVPVKVYGSSGWDRAAFLLPFLKIEFATGAGFGDGSVVVLNLDAPSALLGFNIGGIVGHQFLGNYKVAIDLPRHEMRLQPAQ